MKTRKAYLILGYAVALEAVSPVFNSRDYWEKNIHRFWEAVNYCIDVEPNFSCGSHVHVAPFPNSRQTHIYFSMEQLRKIAYAVATEEYWISQILPKERLYNRYCKFNSSCVNRRWRECGYDWAAYAPMLGLIRREILGLNSAQQLCEYMQGRDRYALWNFQNTVQNRTTGKGTIEFRGGRHLRGEKNTKRWVAFAIAFIALAIEKVTTTELIENAAKCDRDFLHNPNPQYYADINAWWGDLRTQARLLDFTEHLPDKWASMKYEEVEGNLRVRRSAPKVLGQSPNPTFGTRPRHVPGLLTQTSVHWWLVGALGLVAATWLAG